MKKFADLLSAAFSGGTGRPSASAADKAGALNAINLISPYKLHGTWVFDDARVGLHQEPFVSGADTWLDRVTAEIPDAQQGFGLVFSARPFPDAQYRLHRRRMEMGGAWYWSSQLQMEGWLCSALFRYFPEAPRELFVQVKPLVR